MGVYENGVGGSRMDNLEFCTYRVITHCYPNTYIQREGISVLDSDGFSRLPDFLVVLASNSRPVILEVTGYSLFYQLEKTNKLKQQEAMFRFVEEHPEYGAMFFYGECYANANQLYSTLKIFEALSFGWIDSWEAMDNMMDVSSKSQYVYPSRIHWEDLTNTVNNMFDDQSREDLPG